MKQYILEKIIFPSVNSIEFENVKDEIWKGPLCCIATWETWDLVSHFGPLGFIKEGLLVYYLCRILKILILCTSTHGKIKNFTYLPIRNIEHNSYTISCKETFFRFSHPFEVIQTEKCNFLSHKKMPQLESSRIT